MCEDIDEMNFHIMNTHKKYIAENSIREGVTSRTLNYQFSLDTSNRNIRNFLKLGTDETQIRKYSAGHCKMIGHLVKEVLTNKRSRQNSIISNIIQKKPLLFKNFLQTMKNHDSNGINLLWKSEEEANLLVESVISITAKKDVEIQEEAVPDGVLSSFTLDIPAPLSYNLVVDQIVNEKFFKYGLKSSFYNVLDQDAKKLLLRKTGFIAEDKYLLTVGCGLEGIRKHLEFEVEEYKEQKNNL